MQLCTKFMSSIMNNLSDVRKMEEGKIRLAAAPVSIQQIMNNVHEMLTPSIKAGVEFQRSIDVKGNDWVLGDAYRIEQVLTNALSLGTSIPPSSGKTTLSSLSVKIPVPESLRTNRPNCSSDLSSDLSSGVELLERDSDWPLPSTLWS